MKTLILLMILSFVILVPRTSQASSKWLTVGLVCSSTAEAYDASATLWTIARGNSRARELNPLVRSFVQSPWKLVAIKASSVTVLNLLAVKIAYPRKPWVAYAMLFGNCAGKMWLGVNAERVGGRLR